MAGGEVGEGLHLHIGRSDMDQRDEIVSSFEPWINASDSSRCLSLQPLKGSCGLGGKHNALVGDPECRGKVTLRVCQPRPWE